MCLWVLAHRVHPEQPLIFAGNRDELHARPSAPADWWDDAALLAGRDLQAGGTWLGVGADGRFAVVTNFREPPRGERGELSRGALVRDWCTGGAEPADHLRTLHAEAHRYAAFNLLFGDLRDLHFYSNRDAQRSPLPGGIHALANGPFETETAKVVRVRTGLSELLATGGADEASLLELLADRRPAAEAPQDPFEGRLSAPFVLDPHYGTRCTSVVVIDSRRHVRFVERRFGADGTISGESRFELDIGTHHGL